MKFQWVNPEGIKIPVARYHTLADAEAGRHIPPMLPNGEPNPEYYDAEFEETIVFFGEPLELPIKNDHENIR